MESKLTVVTAIASGTMIKFYVSLHVYDLFTKDRLKINYNEVDQSVLELLRGENPFLKNFDNKTFDDNKPYEYCENKYQLVDHYYGIKSVQLIISLVYICKNRFAEKHRCEYLQFSNVISKYSSVKLSFVNDSLIVVQTKLKIEIYKLRHQINDIKIMLPCVENFVQCDFE